MRFIHAVKQNNKRETSASLLLNSATKIALYSINNKYYRYFSAPPAEAFASFSVFVLRTKAFAPSPRHCLRAIFDSDQARVAGAWRNPLLSALLPPSLFFSASGDALHPFKTKKAPTRG
jgi:hypothetical protein